MSAVTVIPSLVPVMVAVAMRRAEARIHRQLTEAGAFSAESAVLLSPSRSLDRRRLEGLIRGGAVHRTANGRHFLDTEGWSAHRHRRQRRVGFALSVAVALIGVGLALFWLTR